MFTNTITHAVTTALTHPASTAVTAPLYTPPAPKAPSGSENTTAIIAMVMWGIGIAGFVGLLVIAGMLFFSDEHKLGKIGTRVAMWFGGATLFGIAGGLVTTFFHI